MTASELAVDGYEEDAFDAARAAREQKRGFKFVPYGTQRPPRPRGRNMDNARDYIRTQMVTERDMRILHMLYNDTGIMTAKQITDLFWGSGSGTNRAAQRRLRLLWERRILARTIVEDIHVRDVGIETSFAYYLDGIGHALLAIAKGRANERDLPYKTKNYAIARNLGLHDLILSELYIRLQCALPENKKMVWLNDFRAGIYISTKDKVVDVLVPDAGFVVIDKTTNRPLGGAYLIEVTAPSDIKLTYWEEKVQNYIDAKKNYAMAWGKKYGKSNPSILAISATETGVSAKRKIAQLSDITGKPQPWYFKDWQTILADEDPFNGWINVTNQQNYAIHLLGGTTQ